MEAIKKKKKELAIRDRYARYYRKRHMYKNCAGSWSTLVCNVVVPFDSSNRTLVYGVPFV